MDDRVDIAILAAPLPSGKARKRVIVRYSAYDTDSNDEPVDNLDEIPINGRLQIREQADEFWGGKKAKDWESPILESPTWLDLCVQADSMIRRVRDTHHVFLEGINVIGVEGDIAICRFAMGS